MMIDRNDVEQQKVVWEQARNGVTQRMAALEEEKNLLVRQLLTVEGAIQACTIILNMDVKDAPATVGDIPLVGDTPTPWSPDEEDAMIEEDEQRVECGHCVPYEGDGPSREDS